jgi:hypothetical protein
MIFRRGLILTIAPKGLCLLLDLEVPAGTILKVEAEGPRRSRVLLARVTHATEQAEGWLHACELANILTDLEISEFLR